MPDSVTEQIASIGVIAYAVYGVLSSHADKDGRCWPSVSRMATMIGVSPRTVRRHIGTLRESGFIEVECRERTTGNLTNVYTLIAPQLPPDTTDSTPVTRDTPTDSSDREGMSPETTTPCHQCPTEQEPINKNQGTRAAVQPDAFQGKLLNGYDTPEVREGLGRWFWSIANHPTAPKRLLDLDMAAVGLCQQCGSAESLLGAINQAIGGGWANLRPEVGNGKSADPTRRLNFLEG